MKKSLPLSVLVIFVFAAVSQAADPLGDFMKGLKIPAIKGGLDNDTIVSGLKEALTVGTGKAVTSVSALDGYFTNQIDQDTYAGKNPKGRGPRCQIRLSEASG